METKLGYIVILPWMREDLDLKGNELLIYALIHGFSQEAQGCFFGSLNYISKACGCTQKTAITTLKSLVERGLLKKRELMENNIKTCQYTALCGGGVKFTEGVKILQGGGVKFTEGGSVKIAPNNKKMDNKYITKGKGPAPLILPYSSDRFRETWEALCEEKEWRKKSENALRMTLKKLGQYEEEFAIELMERTIEKGWKGVVFDDTDAKYQEWKSARQQAMDNAQPRQPQGRKPAPQNTQVDDFYRRHREKEEAERAEQLKALKAKYGIKDDNTD